MAVALPAAGGAGMARGRKPGIQLLMYLPYSQYLHRIQFGGMMVWAAVADGFHDVHKPVGPAPFLEEVAVPIAGEADVDIGGNAELDADVGSAAVEGLAEFFLTAALAYTCPDSSPSLPPPFLDAVPNPLFSVSFLSRAPFAAA